MECCRCGSQFSTKTNLKKHLAAARTCEPKLADLDREQLLEELSRPKNDKHKCACGSTFTRADNQKRHEKTCEAHATASDQGRAASIGTNNGNVNIYQNTYNITNNFGQENLSYLCPKFMKSSVLNRMLGFARWVEEVHFNPDHPENMNVRIENRNKGNPLFVSVYEDGEFKTRVTDEVFNSIRENASISLDDFALNNRELFDQDVEELTDYWLNFGNFNTDKDQIRRANRLIMALLLTQSSQNKNKTKS